MSEISYTIQRSPLDITPVETPDSDNSRNPSATLYQRLRPSRFNVQTTTAEGWLLLWNTYTGSMNAFRPERRNAILKLIDQGGVQASEDGIAAYLLQRGYLIPSDADELRRIRYAFGQENHRSDRLEFILLASEDCNFRCVYCYEDFNRGTMHADVRQSIKRLTEQRAGTLREMTVGWFGGEPLYGLEAIEDLAPFFAETAERHGISYFSHMTTNGYLLTPDVVGKLLSWKISDFQVTLDGIAKDHDRLRPRRDGLGTFEVVYQNLVAMRGRDEDFSVVIRVNFDRASAHGLSALLDRLQEALRDDDRFTISFHAVGQWGGKNDPNLDVCGTGESHAVRMKFKAAARAMGLRVTSGWRPDISVGSEVCYAVRPYNFIIGAHGDVMKCTVDLDKKDRNRVGKLLPDGTLNLDLDKMALWTEPAFERDSGCQSCHMLPACQGVHCPQVRMDHGIPRVPVSAAPPSKRCWTISRRSNRTKPMRRSTACQLATERSRSKLADLGETLVRSKSSAAMPVIAVRSDDPATAARLERFLARRDVSVCEIQDRVESATDAELMPFGLRAYRLNLLSLFGNSWPLEKVLATARRAAISKILGGWEHHHHYLPGLRATGNEPQLRNTPSELAGTLLARGRGLIVMSFHLGHMRLIATDLAHSGISICGPLASDAFNNYRTARIANPQAALWTHLRVVNVEERGGSFTLARTLASGGCVFSTIDGNTGLDGPHGNQRRASVPLLEATAKVKTGLFDLAARFGSPILIVIAHSDGQDRVCRLAPVIDPGQALRGAESKRFVEAATRDAYAFFGATLIDHADEWCGGDLFHQWRVPRHTRPRDLAAVERDLTVRLAAGASLILNALRILPLDGDGDIVWSDAVSGKCYQLPQDMAVAARQLCAPENGIGIRWLDRFPEAARSRMWTLLCQLAARDVIAAQDHAARDRCLS